MANQPSQQQFASWHVPEDKTTEEVSLGLDYHDVDAQQEIQPHVAFENMLDVFPTQNTQPQGMGMLFNMGSEPGAFIETEIYPTTNYNTSYFPVDATVPMNMMNSGTDFTSTNPEGGSNYMAPQAPYFDMYHDCSNQESFLSGDNLGSLGQAMSGQLGLEQLPLEDPSTFSLGYEEMQGVTESQPGFSQIYSPSYEGASADSLLGSLPNIGLDEAQMSSAVYPHPFHGSATTYFEMNENLGIATPLFGQPISGDMSTQWESVCPSANDSTATALTIPVKEVGSFENPVEVTESPKGAAEFRPTLTVLNGQDGLPKPFGPSRSVSLPPARRGGKRGPLSKTELEKRRAAKKQGVCIRCRNMKEECSGGFPCRLCVEKSKAMLLKFPCTKAQFLDLVEYSSYFEDIESFQKYEIEKMTMESFLQKIEFVQALSNLHNTSTCVLTSFLGPEEFKVNFNWRRCTAVFRDICKQVQLKDSMLGRHLVEMPCKLGRSKSSQPPVVVDVFHALGTTTEQLRNMVTFCIAGDEISRHLISHWSEEFSKYRDEMSENGLIQLIEDTVAILLWVSRRYYEVVLFRTLQNALNRLNSLSTDELSKIVTSLLNVLNIGLLRNYRVEGSFLYKELGSPSNFRLAYEDQRKRIRQALFVYFSIALSKLPMWHNFSQKEIRIFEFVNPDIARNHLTGQEAFDSYLTRQNAKENMHRYLLFLERYQSGRITKPSSREQTNLKVTETDFEARVATFREISYGYRNRRVELEAILERASRLYEVMSKIIDILSALKIDLSSIARLQCTTKVVLNVLRDVKKHLGGALANQLGSTRQIEGYLIGEDDIDTLYKIMAYAEGNFRDWAVLVRCLGLGMKFSC